MKSIVIPQPFATLASLGMISVLSSKAGVHPGPIAIQAGRWTSANWDLAETYRVILKGVGIKSRRLMPVDHLIGIASVIETEWISDLQRHKERMFSGLPIGFDADQDWSLESYALHLEWAASLYPIVPHSQQWPTLLLSKAVETDIRSRVSAMIQPWFH